MRGMKRSVEVEQGEGWILQERDLAQGQQEPLARLLARAGERVRESNWRIDL